MCTPTCCHFRCRVPNCSERYVIVPFCPAGMPLHIHTRTQRHARADVRAAAGVLPFLGAKPRLHAVRPLTRARNTSSFGSIQNCSRAGSRPAQADGFGSLSTEILFRPEGVSLGWRTATLIMIKSLLYTFVWQSVSRIRPTAPCHHILQQGPWQAGRCGPGCPTAAWSTHSRLKNR